MHNHGKHPPLFASEHVQEEWRVQQSATWSEDMRVVEEGEMGSDGVRKQRALKSQIEPVSYTHLTLPTSIVV